MRSCSGKLIDVNSLKKGCWYKITYHEDLWLLQHYSTSEDIKIRSLGDSYYMHSDGITIHNSYPPYDGKVYGTWGLLAIDSTITKINRNEFYRIMKKNNIKRMYEIDFE